MLIVLAYSYDPAQLPHPSVPALAPGPLPEAGPGSGPGQYGAQPLATLPNLRHDPRMPSDITFIDILGVIGSLMIAGAYLAVTQGRVDAEKPAYNLVNLAGACLILLSLYFRPNAGAIMIEVLWITIALVALWRWWRRA